MRSVLLACLLFATASATGASWQIAEPGVVASPKDGGFTIQPPPGWFYSTNKGLVVAARNGVYLDCLRVTVTPHKNAFKSIKKTSSVDSLPEDLAENYVASLQAEGVLREIQVLSTDPAEIGGRPGFRVHLRYRVPDGLGAALIEEITLGTTIESGLVLAHYFGPQIHYFQQSLPAAEESFRTLAFPPAAAPK